MTGGKSCALLVVAVSLLMVAGFLGWRGQEGKEAGGGSAKRGGGYSGEVSDGDGTELVRSQRSKRGRDSGQVNYTIEETVVIFEEAEKERSEDEAEFLRFAETIPLERWPLLIEELEKDNPPLGRSLCVKYWVKVDPEALLEFLRGGKFQIDGSMASMVLVEHFAPRDSALAIALFGEWSEAYGEFTDRDSCAQPMVENIASQERHSDEEKFEAWFKGLAEREKRWALEVAPEDSVIR